jgi:hypothetical protein
MGLSGYSLFANNVRLMYNSILGFSLGYRILIGLPLDLPQDFLGIQVLGDQRSSQLFIREEVIQ